MDKNTQDLAVLILEFDNVAGKTIYLPIVNIGKNIAYNEQSIMTDNNVTTHWRVLLLDLRMR